MTATPEPLVQYDKAALATMSAAEIEKARLAGQLDVMLGRDPAEVALEHRARHGRITTAEVAELNRMKLYDLVTAAHFEGRIDTDNEEN